MFEKRLICFFVFVLLVIQSVTSQHLFAGFEPGSYYFGRPDFRSVNDSSAPEGGYVGIIDQKMLYSCNFEANIPDSLTGKNLNWHFSAFIKPDTSLTNAVFVITFTRADTLVYYHGIRLDDQITRPGEWNIVHSDFLFPADHVHQLNLKAYLWNKSSNQFFIDAIELKASTFDLPSYIPHLKPIEKGNLSIELFSNPYYRVLFDKKIGSIVLADSAGIPMTKPLGSYLSINEKGQSSPEENYRWNLENRQENNQKIQFLFRTKGKTSTTELEIQCDRLSPEIHFEAITQFRKNTALERNSIILFYDDELSYVFRKNGQTDSTLFQTEYYLAHGGASIGKGYRNLLLQNSLQISSAQLNTQQKALILNIDYAADHPLIQYPLLTDTQDVYVETSVFQYSKKQKLTGSFNLHLGLVDPVVPRFLLIPDGFDAAIVWTEHADWTNIRAQRAVNYGHEDIREAGQATGGFAGYDIPVTKSVFFNNPDRVTNLEASGGLFPEQHSTIQTDTAFSLMLQDLHQQGFEICLHTPEQYTTNNKNLREALEWMKRTYGSPSWIDHGYNNAERNNRENLVCDGLNKDSKFYAAKLWKENGLRYFWNPWWEEANPYREFGFNGHFNLPFPGFGDAFPLAMVHKHPAFEGLVLWGTTGTLEVPDDAMWNYFFHPQRLQSLVDTRSVLITHVYPAWVKEKKGYWYFDSSNKMVAMEGFNQALQRIQLLKKQRKLLPVTIQKLIDYQMGLQSLQTTYTDEGQIRLRNVSSTQLKGLSMIVNAASVTIDGELPSMKHSEDGLVFWFDLEPEQEVMIRFIEANAIP